MSVTLISKNSELLSKIKDAANDKLTVSFFTNLNEAFVHLNKYGSNDLIAIDIESFSYNELTFFFTSFNFNFLPILIFNSFNEELILSLSKSRLFNFYILNKNNINELILYLYITITNFYRKNLIQNEIIFNDANCSITYENSIIRFTKLEFNLFKYLYINQNHLVSRNELLKCIWGFNEDDYFSRTIDTHIKLIRKKLSFIQNNKIKIYTSRGKGYYLKIIKE